MKRLRVKPKEAAIPEEIARWVDRQIELRLQERDVKQQDMLLETALNLTRMADALWLTAITPAIFSAHEDGAVQVQPPQGGEGFQWSNTPPAAILSQDSVPEEKRLLLEIADAFAADAEKAAKNLCEMLDRPTLKRYKEERIRLNKRLLKQLGEITQRKADSAEESSVSAYFGDPTLHISDLY